MKQNLRQDLQAIQQQLMAGRFQEGVRLCRQVLSYAPNEPNALYMMGVGIRAAWRCKWDTSGV